MQFLCVLLNPVTWSCKNARKFRSLMFINDSRTILSVVLTSWISWRRSLTSSFSCSSDSKRDAPCSLAMIRWLRSVRYMAWFASAAMLALWSSIVFSLDRIPETTNWRSCGCCCYARDVSVKSYVKMMRTDLRDLGGFGRRNPGPTQLLWSSRENCRRNDGARNWI